jgi:Holliday junction resolvase RusA-like endonuclease
VITIEVLGTPAPKGSARAFYKAGMKRAVIVKDNSERQRGWDANVRERARRVVGDVAAPPFVDTPLSVSITFRLARPAGHYRKGALNALKPGAPAFPRGKPDADKLARATLDSLTGIVFDDDARIVELVVLKRYAAPGHEGATITVSALGASAEGAQAA